MKSSWAMVLWVLLGAVPASGFDEMPGMPGMPGNAARGRVLYHRYCVTCHGDLGNGRGESAEWLETKPRDFRQGIFKWRSTPSGSLPLPGDLEKRIENGVYGTFMPAWYAIGHRAHRDLIAYIQTFSPRWESEKPQPPIDIPAEPVYSQESVDRGRAVYEQNECAKCHGEEGHGDGPSSGNLTDDWGNAIFPYDLTMGHIKCGDSGTDIYRVFMTGLSGTPMPSFARVITSTDAWDLVHYIESLSPLYPKKTK